MTLSLVAICIAAACIAVFASVKRHRDKTELERHSISVEELHLLLESDQEIFLFDVRQPLDLVAYPELIPRAQRIPPKEVLDKPALIPRDKDVVVYCTCPGDKTSRTVLRRALMLGFSRIKLLRGGLSAWKEKGYAVEPYKESFRL
jgi:rhodanese-related sulfurtransferase